MLTNANPQATLDNFLWGHSASPSRRTRDSVFGVTADLFNFKSSNHPVGVRAPTPLQPKSTVAARSSAPFGWRGAVADSSRGSRALMLVGVLPTLFFFLFFSCFFSTPLLSIHSDDQQRCTGRRNGVQRRSASCGCYHHTGTSSRPSSTCHLCWGLSCSSSSTSQLRCTRHVKGAEEEGESSTGGCCCAGSCCSDGRNDSHRTADHAARQQLAANFSAVECETAARSRRRAWQQRSSAEA
jgi:hypothetical protein